MQHVSCTVQYRKGRQSTSTIEYQSFQPLVPLGLTNPQSFQLPGDSRGLSRIGFWYPVDRRARAQSFQAVVPWGLARIPPFLLLLSWGLARTQSPHLLVPWGLSTSQILRLASRKRPQLVSQNISYSRAHDCVPMIGAGNLTSFTRYVYRVHIEKAYFLSFDPLTRYSRGLSHFSFWYSWDSRGLSPFSFWYPVELRGLSKFSFWYPTRRDPRELSQFSFWYAEDLALQNESGSLIND